MSDRVQASLYSHVTMRPLPFLLLDCVVVVVILVAIGMLLVLICCAAAPADAAAVVVDTSLLLLVVEWIIEAIGHQNNETAGFSSTSHSALQHPLFLRFYLNLFASSFVLSPRGCCCCLLLVVCCLLFVACYCPFPSRVFLYVCVLTGPSSSSSSPSLL